MISEEEYYNHYTVPMANPDEVVFGLPDNGCVHRRPAGHTPLETAKLLTIISMLVAVVLWFVIGEAAPILRMTAFVLFAGFAVFIAIKEWLEQWITEIAVTDRRVIYKTGLIRRQTAEMNMDKIKSVKVDQSLLGRLLNYGSIHIRGTGEGLEHLDYISSPISLRNTITTK